MFMMECEEAVYSNEFYDFIVEKWYLEEAAAQEFCGQELDESYEAVYFPSGELDGLITRDITYPSIPKCFGLLDNAALESSGIIKVRDQTNLALTGQGVLIGFIDTDFDYTNPLFCHSDGTTRIEAIWNQQDRSGMPPVGFIYGTEYTRSQINEALLAQDSQESIPHTNGHGTFLAALAAGSEDFANQFSGAAPGCGLAFVQLKPAKPYLKELYFIPEQAQVYQENDIMAGLHYLNLLAVRLRKPLAVCIALGTNMGSRNGTSPISRSIAATAIRRQRCIVIAAGNEADKRHHFLGGINDQNAQERVEISVAEGVRGFIAELWAAAPELYEISVISPTGERFLARPSTPYSYTEHQFLFEGTHVSVEYRLVGTSNSNELVRVWFDRPAAGIWTLHVSVRNFIDGRYHVWLPMSGMVSGEVIFLRSNPDTTLTVPADTAASITAAGYHAKDNSIYFASSRGYTAAGAVKPDLAAPAVDVYGPVGNGMYGTRSGTSIAAAITAGAGAMMLEWTGVRGNDISAATEKIKNYLIRGADRDEFRTYPSREWGWGRLDLYQTYEEFRSI